MATPEHEFLSQGFLSTLKEFSSYELYGFTETARRRFDFSCNLASDMTRCLVGQTLWNNPGGLDKDVRTLISDSEARIRAYILRDTARTRVRLEECLNDIRRLGTPPEVFSLKVFWVPQDFDADDESHRTNVLRMIKDRVIRDIIFSVVFGGLSGADLLLLCGPLNRSAGLNLLVLYLLAATGGSRNAHDLIRETKHGVPYVETSFHLLDHAGLVDMGDFSRGPDICITWKGKLFLEILRRLVREGRSGLPSGELSHVLRVLGAAPEYSRTFTRCGHFDPDGVWGPSTENLSGDDQPMGLLDHVTWNLYAMHHLTFLIKWEELPALEWNG